MSSDIDIDNLNKVSDERYQIDKGDQLDKKGTNVKEALTGNNEFLKLGIMSSHSCIDRDYDELDQRENDDKTDKLE